MSARLWRGVLILLGGWVLCGCFPTSEGQSDEQKNEYFIVGKERAAARDYKGAIEAFEKAVETNPRSALAHFELGVLYEQHSEQKEADFVTAMYHYLRAIQLRPNEYPAENSRQRINACKQELVKVESLAPVEQSVMRDLERLKQENQNLRKQLEAAKTQLANRPPVPASPQHLASPPQGSALTTTSNRPPAGQTRLAAGPRITPLPPVAGGRTYAVKPRDTVFAIAKQYGLKVDALLAANPSVNPKKLKPGQVLNIPAS